MPTCCYNNLFSSIGLISIKSNTKPHLALSVYCNSSSYWYKIRSYCRPKEWKELDEILKAWNKSHPAIPPSSWLNIQYIYQWKRLGVCHKTSSFPVEAPCKQAYPISPHLSFYHTSGSVSVRSITDLISIRCELLFFISINAFNYRYR